MKQKNKKLVEKKRKEAQDWLQTNLQTIRTLSGLTLAEISNNTGISVQTLSLIENGKKLPYYQYIVIRKYLDSYLIDSFRYLDFNINTMDIDDITTSLIKPFISITISILCNDMNIWSIKEKDFINEQWNLIKNKCINRDDARTAKTYSKVFFEQFSDDLKNMNLLQFLEILESLKNISSDDDKDYIEFIKECEFLSPLEKVIAFILAELIFVLILIIPQDEVIRNSHIVITKESFKKFNDLKNSISDCTKKQIELHNNIKNELNNYKNVDGELEVSLISLNKLQNILDSIEKAESDYIQTYGPFFTYEHNGIYEEVTIDNFEYIINDWLKLIQKTVLKLCDLNDWFYPITYDGIENFFHEKHDNIFFDSLYALNKDRAEENFKLLDKLFNSLQIEE